MAFHRGNVSAITRQRHHVSATAPAFHSVTAPPRRLVTFGEDPHEHMSSATHQTIRPTAHSPRLVGAAVLFAGATMGVLAGPASASSSSTEGQPEKVFVCKYVGTPDVDERLQTGNNPIEVSVNAIPIYTGQPASDLIGQEFADAQGRSIVIAVSPVRGGGQGDEPTIEDCPAPDGPPEEEPAKVTGTPTLTDPCGPDNEVLSTAPANVVFTPVDLGTSLQVTVSAAAGYVLDQTQTVFNLPVDDAACPTTPETPTTPQTPTTPETPQTPSTPESPEVLPETATQTPGQAPEVLGEQAFAPNNSPLHPQQAQAQPQQAQAQPQQALPTSVNAGVAGAQDQSPVSGTTSLLGMLLVLLGAASSRLAWIRTRG